MVKLNADNITPICHKINEETVKKDKVLLKNVRFAVYYEKLELFIERGLEFDETLLSDCNNLCIYTAVFTVWQ